jgi:colicin import membrane protein
MPPRVVLSDEEEQRERDDRQHLQELERRFRSIESRRAELLDEARRLSAEQKALYDRRQAPQEEVERIYAEHAALGQRLTEVRTARERARRHLDAAVIALREMRSAFPAAERVRPDQLRREIAELELKQQTSALPLDEENALVERIRERTRVLKTAESRSAAIAEHEKQRKEAETRVRACRAEVDRLGAELARAKADRDDRMTAIRAKLEAAGNLVAEMRAKGRARADLMAKVDAMSREMADLDHEARRIHGAARARREEAQRTLRAYTRPRGRTNDEVASNLADAHLQELLKRGKVTLGG